MKKICILLSCIFVLHSSIVVCGMESEGLLRNSGFEEGFGTNIPGWIYNSGALKGECSIEIVEGEDAPEGKQYLKLTDNDTAGSCQIWSNTIPIEAGQKIEVTLYAKITTLGCSIRFLNTEDPYTMSSSELIQSVSLRMTAAQSGTWGEVSAVAEAPEGSRGVVFMMATSGGLADSGGCVDSIVMKMKDASSGTLDVPEKEYSSKASKTRSTYYTEEKRQIAQENISQYSWAAAECDNIKVQADKYVELGYEYLWNMIPSQAIPRSTHVLSTANANGSSSGYNANCPNCGAEMICSANVLGNPWKLTCRACSAQFPTNDFKAYYEGGLDETGRFHPETAKAHNDALIAKGETGNLVNLSGIHAEDSDWGVDDGYGWNDPQSNLSYKFIANYTHAFLWPQIRQALTSLSLAYVYTGEEKYAFSGIVLLDRLADIYPTLNASAHKAIDEYSLGAGHLGKEVYCTAAPEYAYSYSLAYDAFFPAYQSERIEEVIHFLQEKAKQYKLSKLKTNSTGLKINVEDNILKEIIKGIEERLLASNMGRHHAALTAAAVVLDDDVLTPQWLEYKYPGNGGALQSLLVNSVDRDGMGNEAAPIYNTAWVSYFLDSAELLDGYDKAGESDLFKNIKFRKLLSSLIPLIIQESYYPSIGDSGTNGQNYGVGAILNKDVLMTAFLRYEDPIFAQAIYLVNKNSVKNLRGDIFTKEPENVAERIQEAVNREGELELNSDNLAGYGFAILRDGRNLSEASVLGSGVISGAELPIVNYSDGVTYKTEQGGYSVLYARLWQQGDFIECTFSNDFDNPQMLFMNTLMHQSYAVCDVYIDGALAATHSAYDEGGSAAPGDKTALGLISPGMHTIKFVNKDKGIYFPLYNLYLVGEDENSDFSLEAGAENGLRDFWMYYGRTNGHGQPMALHLNVDAYGLDLANDMGRPVLKNQNAVRAEWVNNTLAHNTVMVDQAYQETFWVGTPMNFDDSGLVKLMDVDASEVYPQTETYRRTVMMVQIDEKSSYGIDFFRVFGGDEHIYSFHGNAAKSVDTQGLELKKQRGTYRDTNGIFGVRPASEDQTLAGYKGPGFHWLENVESEKSPRTGFSVDWSMIENPDVHIKLTMLNDDLTDVSLADGERHFPAKDNIDRQKYLLAMREGSNLRSNFTSVIEPYQKDTKISAVRQTDVIFATGEKADSSVVKAVQVTLQDGRTDYIVSSVDRDTEYLIDPNGAKIPFRGLAGVFSYRGGSEISRYLNGGEEQYITGKVTDFTRELSPENSITIQTKQEIKAEELAGRYIYIQNTSGRNGAYRILSAVRKGGNIVLDIGDVTTVNQYKNNNNPSAGLRYNIDVGDEWYLPLSHWEYDANEFGIKQDEKYAACCFKDTIGHWAEKAVQAMADKGIMLGKENNLFEPEEGLSRAELAAVTARFMKLAASDIAFEDVSPGTWYYNAVSAAAGAGIMTGDSGQFYPERAVTREEMIQVLMKIYVQSGKPAPDGISLDAFEDSGQISGWAKKAVEQAAALGLIRGENSRIMPNGRLTRAQASIMLERLMDLL